MLQLLEEYRVIEALKLLLSNSAEWGFCQRLVYNITLKLVAIHDLVKVALWCISF